MKQNIQKIFDRYNTAKDELNNPDVIRDMQKYKLLNQELSVLKETAEKIEKLIEYEKMIKEAEDIIASPTDNDLLSIAQNEFNDYTQAKSDLEKEIENDLVKDDPLDQKNIIVEVRAGTGGDESALFAATLYRMYSRFAEKMGWTAKILSSSTWFLK